MTERVKKAAILIRKVSDIREKSLKNDFKRSMRIYEALVVSVMM